MFTPLSDRRVAATRVCLGRRSAFAAPQNETHDRYVLRVIHFVARARAAIHARSKARFSVFHSNSFHTGTSPQWPATSERRIWPEWL